MLVLLMYAACYSYVLKIRNLSCSIRGKLTELTSKIMILTIKSLFHMSNSIKSNIFGSVESRGPGGSCEEPRGSPREPSGEHSKIEEGCQQGIPRG